MVNPMIRSAIPTTFISAPAKMKSGTANREKLSSELYHAVGRMISGTSPWISKASVADNPMAKARGAPIDQKDERTGPA